MNYKIEEIQHNKSVVKELLEKADNDFCYYLGYGKGVESAINEITNSDDKHKYWVIYIDNELAGLVYIYDYEEDYHKCSLGYGLLSYYRKKGYSTEIIKTFCNFLETELDIVRIQVDIEFTNISCLSWFEVKSHEMYFEFECEAMNYWGQGVNCKIYSRCKEDKRI